MARNKSSKFGVDDNLFEGNIKDTQQVQEVQEVQEDSFDYTQEVQQEAKEIGTTQGKKGQKLKRINMAFSDKNHEYITHESRRKGISATAFVNQIISEYRVKYPSSKGNGLVNKSMVD